MAVFIEGPYTGRYVAPHVRQILVEPPTEEVFTLAQAKLRAGLDWADGDPRDALMQGFIAAAREKVEQMTGLALLTQTRDVLLDALPPYGYPLQLPVTPLQEVEAFSYVDTAGVTVTLDPATYLVDLASGRIGLAAGGWPTSLRSFQPVTVRVIAGWLDVPTLTLARPLLVHAVGLLVAHYATAGRDLATTGTIITPTPQGFEDAIAPYVPETIA